MEETNLKQLHAIVEGRVQGVGFRYFVQRAASERQITGWVRNLVDRSVEVVAEGEQMDLNQLLGTIRKGPTGSHVTNVEVTWKEYTGVFSTFKVRWI